MKRLLLLATLGVLLAACPAYCTDYYVATNGDDNNDGSIDHPFKTIDKAVSVVVAGETIYVRGGTHTYTTTITISKDGTASAKYYLFAYPGEQPILDFSSMSESSSNRGIKLSASYWYIKGIDIYKAGDNGMIIEQNNASYNRIELCNFYENRDTGLQLANGAAYNEIINCDSYYNCDSDQGDADGFAPKLTVGTGNYFYGCRAWNNSDDGYDLYLTTADNVTTTFENCWVMKAGYLKSGAQSSGNGNGFKMGSSTNHHNVILKNCLAFQNKKEGFDQNHNKGSMTLYNCTSYDNGSNNFEISEALSSGYTATVTNCISFAGSVSLAYATQTTNSWQSPFVVTSADFVSTDPSAAYGPRNADGSLPDITFMHLATGSDLIDGGTDVGLPYNGSAPDLGCFETGGGLPGQATNPSPGDGVSDVSINADLSWTAGTGATSHDVYFGTSSPGTFQGNQPGTTFDPGTLSYNTTYYWRIDEKNGAGTTTGDVWSFTTVPPLPGKATNPNPGNELSDISINADLSWTAGSDATSHDVYFGTISPGDFQGNQPGTTFDPGTLSYSTTYYWRIDEKNVSGTTTGDVWSFTTSVPDTTPPTPDPCWASVPAAMGSSSITMTATTAIDANSPPVKYYFECTTDGDANSGWQEEETYIAQGLNPLTSYTFRVKARDNALVPNETAWSVEESATTYPPSGGDVEITGSWGTGLSHTKESGDNRALIFIAHAERNGDVNLSSVEYGGQEMTKVIDMVVGTTYQAYVAAYILDEAGVAAATNNTFVPTWSGTPDTGQVAYGSVFLSNVDQTAPIGASDSSSTTSSDTLTTAALSTEDGDMVIDAATCGNGATGGDLYTVNNGFTEALEHVMTSSTGVDGYKPATGADETPSVTHDNANRQVLIGFVVQAGGEWLYGDFTGDDIVDMNDMPGFCWFWLMDDCSDTNAIDLNEDCLINFIEYSVLAENWLK